MRINKFLPKLLMIGLWLMTHLTIHAQDGNLWSLERCINYAQQNNLNIQQAGVAVQQAELNLKSTQRENYPTLDGAVSYGFNTGRSVDPTTNDFVNRSIHTNGISLSAGVLVYSGGRLPSQRQQNQLDIQAAKMDVENTRQDISIQVAQAYLQVLLAEEQLSNSQINVKQLQDQLAQTEKLIKAGALPANNRYDIEAQIASSEQVAVSNQNSLDIAYLNLRLLLQLEPNMPFKIEKPNITLPDPNEIDVINLNTIYKVAVDNQPDIQSSNLRIQSAEEGIDIARSAYFPTVSVGAGMSTNYSSIGLDFENTNVVPTGNDTISTDVIFLGQQETIDILNPTFDVQTPKAGYFTQLNQNLTSFVGLQVNIPIYDGGQTNINIERARLNVLNAQYNNRILRQNLKSEIQLAVTDAKAAAKQLEASEKSLKAQEAAFENTERRFQVGTANSFEYNTARNNVEGARALYTLAKYDYIFKLTILDFYQGKTIKLD